MKFLVVDDSRLACRQLAQALETHTEAEIQYAFDGKEALKSYLQDPDVDAIFLDWNMPNIPGIDVLKAIRINNRELPIIMVTSLMDEIHEQQAKREGISAYVYKPFTTENIKHVLQMFSLIPQDAAVV